MMTLDQVVKKLTAEKALLTAELKAMQPDSMFNANGWEVINREQELHTTLSVLERLEPPPASAAHGRSEEGAAHQ